MDMQGSTRTDAPGGSLRAVAGSSCRPPPLLPDLLRPAVMTTSPPAARHPAPPPPPPPPTGPRPPRAPWPPDPFSYSDGRLCVGGLALDEVVAATGTPAYVYDLDAVAAAYRRAAGPSLARGGARV